VAGVGADDGRDVPAAREVAVSLGASG